MNYLKIKTSKNNTVLEVSGDPFTDLKADEMEVQSNFDFPSSQPTIFYRWDPSIGIEINDEGIVESIQGESGTLSGLDLAPYIENVLDAETSPYSTNTITILGANFSFFSDVEITGEGNMIETVYFDNPKQLRVTVNAGPNQGKYNIIIKNDKLNSDSSGFGRFIVKNKTVVDLRTIDIGMIGLQGSHQNFKYYQDPVKGLMISPARSSWSQSIKFSNYTWSRNDNITFEGIFTRTGDATFMGGLIGNTVDINTSLPYYAQEIGFFHNNNSITTFYGGGSETNWSQNIGTTINTVIGKFYKLHLHKSGSAGSKICIAEVDPDDWDSERILHEWISDCPANDLILSPFIIPQSNNGKYFWTGFKY